MVDHNPDALTQYQQSDDPEEHPELILPLPPALQSMEEFKTRASFLTGAAGFDAGAFESESVGVEDLESSRMRREHVSEYSVASRDDDWTQVCEASYDSTVSFDSMDGLGDTEAIVLSGASPGQDGRVLPASNSLADVDKGGC